MFKGQKTGRTTKTAKRKRNSTEGKFLQRFLKSTFFIIKVCMLCKITMNNFEKKLFIKRFRDFLLKYCFYFIRDKWKEKKNKDKNREKER